MNIVGGIIGAIVGIILSGLAFLLDLFGSEFLKEFGFSITYFSIHFPYVINIIDFIGTISYGWLIISIIIFALKSSGMAIGLKMERGRTWSFACRFVVFGFLATQSYSILSYFLNGLQKGFFETLVTLPSDAPGITMASFFGNLAAMITSFSLDSTGVTGIVVGLILLCTVLMVTIEFFKLLIEFVEKYIKLWIYLVLAKLAFMMGILDETKEIFSYYVRVFVADLFVYMMTAMFIAGFKSVLTSINIVNQEILDGFTNALINPGGASALNAVAGPMTKYLMWGFFTLAYLKMAQNFNNMVMALGVSSSRSNGSPTTLGSAIMMTGMALSRGGGGGFFAGLSGKSTGGSVGGGRMLGGGVSGGGSVLTQAGQGLRNTAFAIKRGAVNGFNSGKTPLGSVLKGVGGAIGGYAQNTSMGQAVSRVAGGNSTSALLNKAFVDGSGNVNQKAMASAKKYALDNNISQRDMSTLASKAKELNVSPESLHQRMQDGAEAKAMGLSYQDFAQHKYGGVPEEWQKDAGENLASAAVEGTATSEAMDEHGYSQGDYHAYNDERMSKENQNQGANDYMVSSGGKLAENTLPEGTTFNNKGYQHHNGSSYDNASNTWSMKNGVTMQGDGSVSLSNGTKIGTDGSIRAKDGSVISQPGQTGVYSIGGGVTVTNSESGTSVNLGDGSSVTNGVINHTEGSQSYTNGVTDYNNGVIATPTGEVVNNTGDVGYIQGTDGEMEFANGSTYLGGGTYQTADGATYLDGGGYVESGSGDVAHYNGESYVGKTDTNGVTTHDNGDVTRAVAAEGGGTYGEVKKAGEPDFKSIEKETPYVNPTTGTTVDSKGLTTIPQQSGANLTVNEGKVGNVTYDNKKSNYVVSGGANRSVMVGEKEVTLKQKATIDTKTVGATQVTIQSLPNGKIAVSKPVIKKSPKTSTKTPTKTAKPTTRSARK